MGALPSQEKMKFINVGIRRDAIPVVLRGLGLLAIIFSLFLVDIVSRCHFLSPPPPLPFYVNLYKLRDPYFQKVGLRTPHE